MHKHVQRRLRADGRRSVAAFGVPMSLAAVALAVASMVAPASATGSRHAAAAADPGVANTWNVKVGVQSADGKYQGMGFLPRQVFINAGDTVDWQANSVEIHTVTFPPTAGGTGGPPGLTTELHKTPPLDTSDPLEMQPQAPAGSNGVYDGQNYYNSGVMALKPGAFNAVADFRLTFPTPGTYTYLCLVHGATEVDQVIVAPEGTAYPYTQADYDQGAADAAARVTEDGADLEAATAKSANDHTVYMGADSMTPDHEVMVMSFIHPKVTVHVGDTVSFVNDNMAVPHTVTFGAPPAGNPLAPAGDPKNFSGGSLSSGIAPPSPAPGSTFKVTFTKAGTYKYLCLLHADMGMVGEVDVLPAAATAPAPATPVIAKPTFTG
jgi:plastocyanin